MKPKPVGPYDLIDHRKRLMQPTSAQIEAADKLAVKIVTLVVDATYNDGTLGAYEGIECARKIREMILALWKKP